MGKRKVAVAPIADRRMQQVTFSKRKYSLMKKAFELSMLCDCEVGLILFGKNRKLYQFASSNMDSVLMNYSSIVQAPAESKTNLDYLPPGTAPPLVGGAIALERLPLRSPVPIPRSSASFAGFPSSRNNPRPITPLLPAAFAPAASSTLPSPSAATSTLPRRSLSQPALHQFFVIQQQQRNTMLHLPVYPATGTSWSTAGTHTIATPPGPQSLQFPPLSPMALSPLPPPFPQQHAQPQ